MVSSQYTIIITILTIIDRFKSLSSGSWARILDLGSGGQSSNMFITVNRDNLNKLGYYSYSSDGSEWVGQSSDLVVNDGVWRHLVWTIDTNGTWTMYINGRVSIRSDFDPLFPPYTFRPTAWLGKSKVTNDSPYNGYMDDLRIYNTLLTPTAVSALYNYSAPNGNTTLFYNYYINLILLCS